MRLQQLSTALPRLYLGSPTPLGEVEEGEEGTVVRSPWPDVAIPEMNLSDYVWEHTAAHPEAVALVCGMTGRSVTYSQARATSRAFSSALLRGGARPGDVLCLLLPNSPDFPLAFLGAVGARLAVTTCKPAMEPEELARRLESCQAKVVVTTEAALPGLRQAQDSYTAPLTVILVDAEVQDCLNFHTMIEQEEGLEEQKVGVTEVHTEVAAMPYSSGTTGAPKGVLLSHFNMVASSCQSLAPGVAPCMAGEEQEVALAVLPFHHIYAMMVSMVSPLRLGHRLVTLPHYEPEVYLKALATFQPSVVQVVPPILAFLAASRTVRPAHLASLRLVLAGAAHFDSAVVARLQEKLPEGCELRQGFGLTETASLTHAAGAAGGIGSPLPNTWARVVDWETGEAAAAGERGELVVAGPQVMLGYHRNSRATRRHLAGHWLHTGDVATYDAATGEFRVIDRLREMMKVKGMFVAPSEVEAVVREHPGVTDAAVVGVPDEMTGERPRAYCVRRNTNVLEEEVMAWVEERLPGHMRLGSVMFVDSLPKNSMGKTMRKELKVQVFKGSFGGF